MMRLSSLVGTGLPRHVSKVFSSRPTSAVASFSTQGGSSSSAVEAEQPPLVNSIYVHHVTKIVLQHLQETKADWLVRQGLDRGLRLKSNGTAVLQFPPKQGFDSGGRIWYVARGTDCDEGGGLSQKHCLRRIRTDLFLNRENFVDCTFSTYHVSLVVLVGTFTFAGQLMTHLPNNIGCVYTKESSWDAFC
eukprot:scaffold793_cov161-Amphora_coffeaeformis.AAC.11